jgi:hypothetical protein
MRAKIIILMLFCAISSMAQRQEVPLKEWKFSTDGKNWKAVSVPHIDKSVSGKCYYRTNCGFENKYTHAELLFSRQQKDLKVRADGWRLHHGENGSRGFRIDASQVFAPKEYVKVPGMLDGPGMMRELMKEFPIEIEKEDGTLDCDVSLVASGLQGYETRIDNWSVTVAVLSVNAQKAVVEVSATPLDTWPKDSLSFTIYSPDDKYVTHEIVPAKSGEPSTVRLEIDNPQLSTDKKSYTYEVDLSLFATANSFKTGQPEAVPRDSYRKAFTIKAAPMASHPAFGKERPGRKKKTRR